MSIQYISQHNKAALSLRLISFQVERRQTIMDTVNRLSESYSYFTEKDLQETKREIIDQIKNAMTDRCAANHAALRIVCSHWKKNLNELNCHLHPRQFCECKSCSS